VSLVEPSHFGCAGHAVIQRFQGQGRRDPRWPQVSLGGPAEIADGLHAVFCSGTTAAVEQVAAASRRWLGQAFTLGYGSGVNQAAGTRRVYSVDSAGIAAIREYFEQFWQQSLASFRTAASQPIQEET
jgi:hypothetical protein